jgi:hypothetical protein
MYWFDPAIIDIESNRIYINQLNNATQQGLNFAYPERIVLFLSPEGQKAFSDHLLRSDYNEIYLELLNEIQREKDRTLLTWNQEVRPIVQEKYDAYLNLLRSEGYTVELDDTSGIAEIRNTPKDKSSFVFELNEVNKSVFDHEKVTSGIWHILIKEKASDQIFTENSKKVQDYINSLYRMGNKRKSSELERKYKAIQQINHAWKAKHEGRYWRTFNDLEGALLRKKNTFEDIVIEVNGKKGTLVHIQELSNQIQLDITMGEGDQATLLTITVGETPYTVYYSA